MRIGTWIVLGLLGFVGAARAEPPRPAQPARVEATPRGEVVWRLHSLHCAEVSMAKLAGELSQWGDARAFAQRILRDHRMANKDLLTYAAEADLRIEPVSTYKEDDYRTRAMLEQLKNAKAGELDRELLAMMVRGHGEAIELVRQLRDGTGDRDLQKLLDDLVPTLQKHRDLALELQVRLRARPPVRSSAR